MDDLAKGAGISRPTFYFYFPSKDAVLLTLLERVIVEADAALEGLIDDLPSDAAQAWRDGIFVFFDSLRAHRGGRASPAWPATSTNPEVRRPVGRLTCRSGSIDTRGVIEAERARGAAPDTVPAHELSTAAEPDERAGDVRLVSRLRSRLSPTTRVLDTLVHIWVTSIYGEPERPTGEVKTSLAR